MKTINVIVFLCLLMLSFDVAAQTPNVGFFAGLWDFIDWVYEVFQDLKNSILEFLIEMANWFFWLWLKMKIATVEFVWSIVEPIIGSLNLSDVVNSSLAGINQDVLAFIVQSRIIEGINILLSAHVTAAILRVVGW